MKKFHHPSETSCDLRACLFYSYHFYSKRNLNCNISLCIKAPAVKHVEKYFLPDLLDSFDLILNFLVQIQHTEAGKRLE